VSKFLKEHIMSDHVTPESAFFSAEEKVQILSGKCPGITKGRLKVWLSFRKRTARDGSASSDGTKAVLLQRYVRFASIVVIIIFVIRRSLMFRCTLLTSYVYHMLISDRFNF